MKTLGRSTSNLYIINAGLKKLLPDRSAMGKSVSYESVSNEFSPTGAFIKKILNNLKTY